MKLFRTKVWSPLDIGSLKWCCILFGMIAGAYLSEFTKSHVWVFAIAVVLLAIKPMIAYFGKDDTAPCVEADRSTPNEPRYNEPTFEQAERYLTVIRDMIRHENTLLNQRLGWLFALQGLLFSAAAFLWRASALPVIAFSFVGILACVSIGHTLARGQHAIRRLLIDKGQKYTKRLPQEWIMPPIIGSRGKAIEWLLPGRFLPWVLGVAWIAILVFRIANLSP